MLTCFEGYSPLGMQNHFCNEKILPREAVADNKKSVRFKLISYILRIFLRIDGQRKFA